MKKNNVFMAILMRVMFIGGFLFFGILMIGINYKENANLDKNYIYAVASVIDIENGISYDDTKSNQYITYTPIYKLDIGGTEYIVKSPNNFERKIEIGQEMRIYYDQDNPYDIVFSKEKAYILYAIGSLFILVVIFFFTIIKKTSKSEKKYEDVDVDKTMKNSKRINFLDVTLIFGILIGLSIIFMSFYGLIKDNIKTKDYEKIQGEVINVDRYIEEESNYKTHILYSATIKYMVNNKEYEIKKHEGSFNNLKIGQNEEIRYDKTNPWYAITKESGVNVSLMIFGVLLTSVLSMFALGINNKLNGPVIKIVIFIIISAFIFFTIGILSVNSWNPLIIMKDIPISIMFFVFLLIGVYSFFYQIFNQKNKK